MGEVTGISWWTEKCPFYKMNEPTERANALPALTTTRTFREVRVMADSQPNSSDSVPQQSDTPVTRGQRQARSGNPNWRGGRSIASNGYVLIRVGVGHHLADVRGYAYEHRLVAEEKIGRRLVPGEIAHHKDENKQNNAPENIEVVMGNAEHFKMHRKRAAGLRDPGEANPLLKCECGCGGKLLRFDSSGRPRKFISGHNQQPIYGLPGQLILYLEIVPESRNIDFICGFVCEDRNKVLRAARSLERRGLVAIEGSSLRLAI